MMTNLAVAQSGQSIYPVILAGGAGTRLWPSSRVALPTQLLALAGDRTMLQETVLRVAAWPNIMPPIVVCGIEHRFLVAEQMRAIGIAPLCILLEPCARNTAAAAAVAAYYLKTIDPNGLLLILPANQLIADNAAFAHVAAQAAVLAEEGALASFGIVPTGPDTSHGYIRRGCARGTVPGAYAVDRFVEKPELELARRFVEDARYYWNSGIFLFSCARYLSELQAFAPAINRAADDALRLGCCDLDFYRLHEASFTSCPATSIGYAVMEHTSHAVIIPAEMGCHDVGSWSSLWQAQQGDGRGNVQSGDVFLDGVSNSLVRAESRMVAVVGVCDLIVVETADAVLVAHRDQVQRVKHVVSHLRSSSRAELLHHTKVFRPWGHYEGTDAGSRFQVKRITVKPGAKLSLQMHHHRAEHWVVVAGTALVTCGDSVCLLSENESTYIPIGMHHRLENPGKVPLQIIEVQSGSYLDEDDIVRFDDVYQRI